MYQLLIYTSKDKYSDKLRLADQKFGDTPNRFTDYIEHYKHLFQRNEFCALHIVQLKIEPDGLEVLMNEYGSVPVKERLVLNPEALVVRNKKGIPSDDF